jgi:hypothetical protein
VRTVSARVLAAFGIVLAASCAPPRQVPPPVAPAGRSAPGQDDRERVAAFAQVEGEAIDWLAASDPRLAARLATMASKEVLAKIGTEAVLAEDATALIHEGALDLFAFRARALALERAASLVGGFSLPLPEAGGPGASLDRPRLERELLVRLIDEERGRAAAEAKLGDASGDLVRGILSTWQAPSGKDAWQERDAWISRHLIEIQKSLQDGRPRTGPLDLDQALYPLERVLAPLEFPRGSAALARVRVALDEDARAAPPLASAESVALGTRAHLGLTVDVVALRPRLEPVEAYLRGCATALLAGAGTERAALEARARALLFVEGTCPGSPASRVRAAGPPPERAAICGLLRSLGDEGSRGAAIVALHDDVLLALAAVDRSPPPRTALLSRPDNDRVDELRRQARERPVVALGLALAAAALYGGDPAAVDARTGTWLSLGDVPLDVVERELGR